jgi:type IV/VI secretion system ImpK/VasF family protein
MNLSELCQPVFQYVCLLNRSARKGVRYDLNQVRSTIQAILAEVSNKAATDRDLAAQFKKIEPILLFFIDFMIKESRLSFAKDWQDMALERNEPDGDERFFDIMDDTLRDPSPAATDRLRIFYTCLGLGFTGFYAGQPDHLRRRMLELSARLRLLTNLDHRIVPEAYENVNTSNLIDPPAARLVGIGIALAGLTLVLFAANFYVYHKSAGDLNQAVHEIIETTNQSAPAPSNG